MSLPPSSSSSSGLSGFSGASALVSTPVLATDSQSALVVQAPLTHDLGRHYEWLRAQKNRRQLLKSPRYVELQDELERVLNGIERGVPRAPSAPASSTAPGTPLRIAAWNIQRGQRFEGILAALREQPILSSADVLLLCEVDCGMGRSGNRHVAAELAAALKMHYAFGVSYLVLGDDFLENPEGKPNTLALAGTAVLARWPLGRIENVDLPELRDKFSSRREKRLGKKRALLVEVLLPDGPLYCAACHLDSNAGPRQRAEQLDALLLRAEAMAGTPSGRIVVGGDLNTTTYDAANGWALFRDLFHKYFITGFNRTVEGYMQPELGYDRPVFDVLARHGFAIQGFNDRASGTYFYDVMSPYAVKKLHSKVGRILTRQLQRRLRPWNGVVPARLDWFAGRGVTPVGAAVVELDRQTAEPVSDHAPITVDILTGPRDDSAARQTG